MSDTNMDDTRKDDLQPEYRFDYTKVRPNRFAERLYDDQIVIVLDPDVAAVFHSADAVNRVLRALIETMPQPPADFP